MKEKINFFLSAVRASAVPGSASGVHLFGQQEAPSNFLPMYDMACNSSGVIGSAIYMGILWRFNVGVRAREIACIL